MIDICNSSSGIYQIKGFIMMYKKDYCENNVKMRVDMIGKVNHKRKENRNG